MSQLKMLRNSVVGNCLQNTAKWSSANAAIAGQQRSYGTDPSAMPLKEMPAINLLKLLFDFLPGGKYKGADVTDIVKGMLQDSGSDIMVNHGIFGKPAMVITQNPDDFEQVYRHDGAWPYRKGFELLNYHRQVHRREYFGNDTGLLTSQNKEWGDMRSAVNPIIIHPKNVKLYLGALDGINQQFIERIKTIRDPNSLEMPNNFKDEISAWTLESVGMIALDRQLGIIDNTNPTGRRFFTLLQRFIDLAVDLEVKPSLWRIIKTPKLKEVLKALDEATEITEKYVQEAVDRIEREGSVKPDHERSVVEKLLAIDRKWAVTMAMDMLFAGVDTTTSTFTGILLALAKNPEKQDKLREEVLRLMPNKDTPLTVESMKNLPYLRAVIKESLRYYPLTAGNVRTIREDLVLSGYHVPKGTEVGLVHCNLFRNSTHFSRPDEFIPERWLRERSDLENEEESRCPATKPSHPFAYLPFGFGARSCIGRRIAEMELEIGVARLVRHFEVQFNYPVDKPFVAYQLATPRIPLNFKFIDLKY